MIFFSPGLFIPSLMDHIFQPSLRFRPHALARPSFFLTSCAIVVIVDAYIYSLRSLAGKLRRAWILQDNFRIEGRIGCFFLVSFNNPEDRDFVVDNGPWSINNSLLVADRWYPNMFLREMVVGYIPVWVQCWGLPLGYHNEMVANTLGDIVGQTVLVQDHSDCSSSLNFLRARVLINP